MPPRGRVRLPGLRERSGKEITDLLSTDVDVQVNEKLFTASGRLDPQTTLKAAVARPVGAVHYIYLDDLSTPHA
jgi:hypothetical protein